MRHRSGIVALIVLGGLALAAPQLDAQTVDQDRTYRLVSVEGQTPPVTVEEEGDDCREEVTGATLTLRTDGEWRLEVEEREICGDAIEEEETEDEEGTYTIEGDTVHFSEDDDDEDDDDEDDDDDDEEDEIDLDDLDVGTLDADGLTVRLDGGRVAVFRP